MSRVIEFVLNLQGGTAYALVFALAALESSAFIGLLFPGELAILLGGVLSFQGRVSLGWMATAAILGAIVGDSVGYAVGARWGEALFRTRLGHRLVRPERRLRAEELLRRRGATAVVVGRFTAVLRVLVPGLAGMAGLPYLRFLLANAVGGIIWAGGLTLLGYAAGNAWRRVEHVAARASLLLGIFVIVVVGLAVAARRVVANEERLRAWWERFLHRPGVARFRDRYATQIAFLFRRLDPREALGLYLTIGLVLSVGAGWAFGAAVQDIVAHEHHIAIADAPLARFVAAHRSIRFTRALKALTAFGSPGAVVAAVTAASLFLARAAKSVRPAAFVMGSVAGGELLHVVVGSLVARPVPVGGLVIPPEFSFPSGHTVVAVTLFGAVAVALSARPWPWAARVWVWAAAGLLVLVVGLCAVYLAIAHASDVVGGAALGAAWLAVCATGWRTWERLNRRTTHGATSDAAEGAGTARPT